MKEIFSNNSPKPAGHYSQAIEHDGIVYVSGQLPINPNSEERLVGSIEEQTQQALSNLENILIQSRSDKNHVIKVTVYLSDIALWDRVNSVYAHFFEDHRPARVIVPTRDLHYGFQIEIEAIAVIADN